jgi:hypothetical protein
MAMVIKLKRSHSGSSVPTTSDLVAGEIAVNTADKKIYMRDDSNNIVEVANGMGGGAGSFTTLTASGATTLNGDVTLGDATGDDITFTGRIASHMVPKTNNTYSLGTSALRWNDLYLAGDTIDIGGSTISADGTGTITIASSGVTLPIGSKDGNNNKFALVGTGANQQSVVTVPIYTQASGLSTAAATFEFNATITDRRVFPGKHTFTLSDGTDLTETSVTLFQL